MAKHQQKIWDRRRYNRHIRRRGFPEGSHHEMMVSMDIEQAKCDRLGLEFRLWPSRFDQKGRLIAE